MEGDVYFIIEYIVYGGDMSAQLAGFCKSRQHEIKLTCQKSLQVCGIGPWAAMYLLI